ncbi:MAG: hypothetical protein JWN78_898 [Bacteroidota bacterium]|nr:hypothetical protein [Bacteroidota bacterium]
MKTLILLLAFFANISYMRATKNNERTNPIIGTWKYKNQSIKNDFQFVLNSKNLQTHSESFIFEPNHKFRHEFINDKGEIIKVLTGQWKTVGEKIKISYNTINYAVNVDYFFLDHDLVLGQNFNHVIFSKESEEINLSNNTDIVMK